MSKTGGWEWPDAPKKKPSDCVALRLIAAAAAGAIGLGGFFGGRAIWRRHHQG